MADPTYKKISQLTELKAHPATDDIFPLVDVSAGETKYVTLANIDKLKFLEATDPNGSFIAYFNNANKRIEWLGLGNNVKIVGGSLLVNAIATADIDDEAITLAKLAEDARKKVLYIGVYGEGVSVIKEDGVFTFIIPEALNGWKIKTAHVGVLIASGDGDLEFDIYSSSETDSIFTTTITIDEGETTSYTAATPPVIDTSKNELVTGETLRFDVVEPGIGAFGLAFILEVV